MPALLPPQPFQRRSASATAPGGRAHERPVCGAGAFQHPQELERGLIRRIQVIEEQQKRPLLRESHQLAANTINTTTFPIACHNPTDFARVRDGIPSQSIKPKIAATSPLITPAAIM